MPKVLIFSDFAVSRPVKAATLRQPCSYNGLASVAVDRSTKKGARQAPFRRKRSWSGRRVVRRVIRSPVMPKSLSHSVTLLRQFRALLI